MSSSDQDVIESYRIEVEVDFVIPSRFNPLARWMKLRELRKNAPARATQLAIETGQPVLAEARVAVTKGRLARLQITLRGNEAAVRASLQKLQHNLGVLERIFETQIMPGQEVAA